MDTTSIDRVRRFNRTVAERIGAMDERFLGRDRPMGEARTLWEVGLQGIEVRALRARLGLDPGYASRVLRSLERQGLVAVEPSPADRRVRRVRLTAAGRAERAELDRRSDDIASRILAPLGAGQRARLVAAMAEVERLLHASMVSVALEDPGSADARWCLAQYFAELDARFEAGFDPGRSLPADAPELTPPSGALLLARLRGEPVGCGAVKLHPGAPAELKRMWVAPGARGLGLGRRLLEELERHARAAGAAVARLETNRALDEAVALYRGAGYREVAPFSDEAYAHHWFEKDLAGDATALTIGPADAAALALAKIGHPRAGAGTTRADARAHRRAARRADRRRTGLGHRGAAPPGRLLGLRPGRLARPSPGTRRPGECRLCRLPPHRAPG